MTRKEILAELNREIKMREKVWRGVKSPGGVSFADMKHQKQFDMLVFTYAVVDVMTDVELEILKERINRRIALQESQQSLF